MKPPQDKSLTAVDASIRAELARGAQMLPEPARVLPFITISRQPGIEVQPLAEQVIARLHDSRRPGSTWSYWDANLLQRVADEHHLSQQLVKALEEVGSSWVRDLIEGFRIARDDRSADEFTVYRRVTLTIRGLAAMGRTIIVGRGGVFATRDMPGGIHVRLVAPLEYRLRSTASAHHLTIAQARQRISEELRYREAFYQRHWPSSSLDPESFTITLNVSALSIERIGAAIAALVPNSIATANAPPPEPVHA